jgi:hypothetical protein
MSNVFDRLAQGPQDGQPQQFDNWNEMVGAAPRETFQGAATQAVRQLNPQEYYDHTQPGVGDTDPLGGLETGQRAGLAQSLIGALLGQGLGQSEISRAAGLSNMDPQAITPHELAGLAQYMQREQPDALAQAAADNQNEPGLLESLLGNKGLMALAAGLGAKMLSDHVQGQGQAPQFSQPGQQPATGQQIGRRGETRQA